jgi:RimJ/RimL family protein N-acetyltransferase
VIPTVAKTSRLLLRGWTDSDVEPLARIGTAEVVRYLGGTPWTTTAARDSIDLWRQIDERLGLTTWAVCERASGELIGTCGFAGTNMPWLRFDFVIEIGWTLGRQWWGQGLATEAASAALEIGLGRYPRERFLSKCQIENHASERVMERIGMHRVGVVQGTFNDPTVLHRLT